MVDAVPATTLAAVNGPVDAADVIKGMQGVCMRTQINESRASGQLPESLTAIVRQWDGVSVSSRHGCVEFRVGGREIGHLHPGGIADLAFPVRVRRLLVSSGRAQPHHTLPHTGWVTLRLRTEHDIPSAVSLFRMNYERMRKVGTPLGILPMLAKPTMLGDRVADDLPA